MVVRPLRTSPEQLTNAHIHKLNQIRSDSWIYMDFGTCQSPNCIKNNQMF